MPKLRDYQLADLVFYMKNPKCLNLSDPGCQPAGSQVLMADGTWKNIENIKCGDKITSPQKDGSVSLETVLQIESHFDQEIMEVSSRIGSYRCSWNHIIPHISLPLIKGKRTPQVVDLPCDEILKTSNTYQEKAKLFTTPAVEFPQKELPLPPYFLGVYLGDGTSNGSVTLHLNEHHLGILDRLKAFGIEPQASWKERGCHGFRFHGLRPVLKSLDLLAVKSSARFVPEMYKQSTIQDRLELLAGLLDTDGSSDRNYYTTSEQLADDVVELVRSVGGMAVKRPKVTYFQGKRCDSFSVYCSFAEHQPYCKVLLKQPTPRDLEWKNPRNHSLTIKSVDRGIVYGFTMTGASQWYVTDNWIVTHNTGKTPSVCVYLRYLWDEKKARSVWTMPKSLLKKNLDELILFSEMKPEDVIIVDGTPAQRKKQLASDAKIFLMGFDCFSRNWEQILEAHPDINALVVDEIHMGYGSDTSKRTKEMYKAMEHLEYFLAMTGTIINGRLSSAYPSIKVIDPKYYNSYYSFLLTHAIEDAYGNVVAWTNPQKISRFFGRYAVRHTFEEAYGPEAKIIINEQCQMDKRQREAYDEFEETALLELEESFLEGSLPGVNFIRCRQLMEHPQEFGPPLDKIKLTGKEERLVVHLEDAKQANKPMIVFSSLKPSQRRIVKLCEDIGLRTGLINGDVSQKKRFEIDEAFRAGELDVVVGSPATMAVGFNWGHVDTMVFTSLDYMDSSFMQGYRRAIRGKRETPLLIYVLEYENSVDQRIFAIVEQKSKMAHDVDSTTQKIVLTPKETKKKKPTLLKSTRKMGMGQFV